MKIGQPHGFKSCGCGDCFKNLCISFLNAQIQPVPSPLENGCTLVDERASVLYLFHEIATLQALLVGNQVLPCNGRALRRCVVVCGGG